MPIYEYRCTKCGKVSEILQRSFNREELPVCTHCGATEMQKIISTPGSIIMGDSSQSESTCCGREERCSTPPCSDDGVCRRDK